jgi:hypothetical protein
MEEHRKEEHGYICAICNAKESEWSGIKNHTLNEHGGYLSSETNSGLSENYGLFIVDIFECQNLNNHFSFMMTEIPYLFFVISFFFDCIFLIVLKQIL